MRKDSLDRLYEEYAHDVFRYLFSLSRDDGIAEDIMQETFYRAYLEIEQLTDEKIKPREKQDYGIGLISISALMDIFFAINEVYRFTTMLLRVKCYCLVNTSVCFQEKGLTQRNADLFST
ncbi:sigma factor [Pseudalkalibacillus sp. SCS-8]|uniref:sigma factor n=1 Tax=Pseudalkalibacillus nanhaiensis TaxID=3115291 RepID=UPI0032DB44A3